MVICYHYFPHIFIFNFGWSGVDLFFVLSGFLITGRLLPYLDDKKILLKFYRNRFLRIVPLYFSFLILFFACWFLLNSKETLNSFKFYNNHWWQFFLFIQNWVFAGNIHEIKTHLLHLWSIAVEEQIYLLFPLFLLFIRKKKIIFFTSVALIFSVLIYRCIFVIFFLADDEYNKIFWNTFFRLDSFLAGVLVYFVYNKIIKVGKLLYALQWIGLICLALILAQIIITTDLEKNNPFTASYGYTIIAIMYASLLWTTLLKKNKLIKLITSARFLRFTGKISYCMYIIHWPLFLTGFAVLNKIFSFFHLTINNNAMQLINALCCIPLTYFLSYISFKYFESYFLRKKLTHI